MAKTTFEQFALMHEEHDRKEEARFEAKKAEILEYIGVKNDDVKDTVKEESENIKKAVREENEKLYGKLDNGLENVSGDIAQATAMNINAIEALGDRIIKWMRKEIVDPKIVIAFTILGAITGILVVYAMIKYNIAPVAHPVEGVETIIRSGYEVDRSTIDHYDYLLPFEFLFLIIFTVGGIAFGSLISAGGLGNSPHTKEG